MMVVVCFFSVFGGCVIGQETAASFEVLCSPLIQPSPDYYTGCFFLNDIFEMLISPSILQISSFCKVVMTNQTGPFDNQQRKLQKKYYNIQINSLNIKCNFQNIR